MQLLLYDLREQTSKLRSPEKVKTKNKQVYAKLNSTVVYNPNVLLNQPERTSAGF